MTLTFRAAIELGLGLCTLVAAVVIGMNSNVRGGLTDLGLGLASLAGIVIMAHAVWLMRRNES